LPDCDGWRLLQAALAGDTVTDEESAALGAARMACLKRGKMDWQAVARDRDDRLAAAESRLRTAEAALAERQILVDAHRVADEVTLRFFREHGYRVEATADIPRVIVEAVEHVEKLAARLALADRLLAARWRDGNSAFYAFGDGIQITRAISGGGHFVSRSRPAGELAYLDAKAREWVPVRFRRESEEAAYAAWLDSIRFTDEFEALAALDEAKVKEDRHA